MFTVDVKQQINKSNQQSFGHGQFGHGHFGHGRFGQICKKEKMKSCYYYPIKMTKIIFSQDTECIAVAGPKNDPIQVSKAENWCFVDDTASVICLHIKIL